MASTNKILYGIILSSLLTVAPWFFNFPILSLIGLVLFVLTIRQIKTTGNNKDHLYLIFLWSLVYNLLIFGSWAYSIFPMTQFGIPDWKYSLAIVGFLWLTTSIGYSLPALLFGFLNFKKNNKYINLLFFPSVWIFYEYTRAHMMSLVWYSDKAYIGPHFAMGTIGYYFSSSDFFRLIASFIGVFGVGFLVAFLANYLAKLYFEKNNKKIALILTICLLLIYLPLPRSRGTDQNIDFALIQTNRHMATDYTPREIRDHLQNIFSLIKEASEKLPKDSPSVIILPEASDLFEEGQSLISREGIEQFLSNTIPQNSAIIVEEDTPATLDTPRFGASVIYSKIPANPSHYEKTVLSVGSEYIPRVLVGVSRMFIGTTTTDELVNETFTPNDYKATTLKWNGFNIAPFTCSDILSPDFVRLQSLGADFGYVHVNLGYTRGNPQIEKYTQSQAQLNTAQNGLPLLLAANLGQSMVFDRNGDIVAIASTSQNSVLTGKITTNSKRTWYNKFGNWPIFILSLVIIFWHFKRKNKR